MPSSGMLRRMALVRNDVPKEPSASVIRVTRIGEVGTTLAVTSNRRTSRFLSPWRLRHYIPPRHRFLEDPHGVTSQKTAFFKVKVYRRFVN
jgi:hypothetical protein